ncbi:hypothetical protein INT46_005557 [Mucor plumbeus]|uniref:HAT C-terminal dimerisation domain-containing protein n=1 Tax=Mucor plumbeus TaxID=97098 RepID=A0A8H7UYR3_9FUNG|nr:hypothetical protein INT46_005557 [Mucor plumbeus]
MAFNLLCGEILPSSAQVQLIEGNDEIIKHYVETNADLKKYLDIDHRIEYKSKLKLCKSKLQNDDDGDDEIEHEDEVAMTNMELGKKYATLPLKFWKQHENLFPTLSLFARKHLSIPATSVPAERLFSQAKYIINGTRAKLHPDTGEKIVLLTRWQNELFIKA